MSEPLEGKVLLDETQFTLGPVAKDLTAGAIGGVAQILIGQPFDLVKVRLQIQGDNNVVRTVRELWAEEGIRTFYRGTLMPLMGIGACVSIQFGAFEACRGALEAFNSRRSPGRDTTLSLAQLYLAGGAAGVANSVISGPVERIRILLQMQPSGSARLYASPWDCIRQVVRLDGLRGLYRGQVATVLRDFQGFGLWFAGYEGATELLMRSQGRDRSDVGTLSAAFCGAVAGNMFWLGAHPIDVVKSKMQNGVSAAKQAMPSVSQTTRQTWEAGGLRAFYYGLGPALFRASLTSAGTFVTVEFVRDLLR